MHQQLAPEHPVKKTANNELTSYKDLVINYLIRSNAQVAHTLIHTPSSVATLEAFHFAGAERKKTRKSTAYLRSALEDNTPAGVLLISAATAGFQGIEFAEWLAWARMLAKSGLSIEDQPVIVAEAMQAGAELATKSSKTARKSAAKKEK